MDPLRHEVAMPRLQLRAWMARERGELEFEELVDVQRAVLVALEKPVVARVVLVRVHGAGLDQVLRPRIVAVTREERVVEVEEGEARWAHACIAALSNGTVTGRPVSSEYWSIASSAAMSEPMSRRACVSRYEET